VKCRDDRCSRAGLSGMMWVKRIRNSYPLLVREGNESCHLVFWSLRCRDDRPSRAGLSGMMWVKRIRNSYPLLVREGNESCHIVF